ncbi:hypothetical protein PHLCEN_2v12061 [Hermanssonia centrifuga]|uniref:Uncharacterized protein n=1 Tax=Hermanssonia centrifuga TaxID=98765 RepID=A0A2R6NI97_9APHY|nr:hypothetical protein PHLCEN_2v12061 [Hermanssonia centrifuga]
MATEDLSEWKEGSDKVVEQSAGPGEDVKVDVQKNAYGPEQTTTHPLHEAEEAARDIVHRIRQKLSPENTEGKGGRS